MTTATLYVLTYTDPKSTNEFLGAFRTLDEAKQGGNRHFGQRHPGSPKWENNGIGAQAKHDKALYDIKSFVVPCR
jgi:hypothetical protein